MAEKHWIQGAIKHPGALKAAAARAKQPLSEYMKRTDLSPVQQKRVNLAKTLKKMHSK